MLEAQAVTVRYRGSTGAALHEVSAVVRPRHLLAVVGPNGSGKTTLLRALLGSVPVTTGRVILEGRLIQRWRPDLRARLVGVVSQREEYPFAWRAEDVVMFGRYPWLGPLAPPGSLDRTIVDTAMARCDVTHLKGRRVDTLSGGEWQRVRVARALAQEPRLLLLDEPTASLDLGHEMELLELVRQLVDEGLGGIVITHHLNVAARFADEMLLLAGGTTVARGAPAEVMEAGRLSAVFGWPILLTDAPEGGPQIVPERRRR